MTPNDMDLCNFFTGLGVDLRNLAERGKKNEEKADQVSSPSHYKTDCGMEVIDIIESFDLNFNLGNAVKYILRAGKKDYEITDLKKAVWYLKRQISKLEDSDE